MHVLPSQPSDLRPFFESESARARFQLDLREHPGVLPSSRREAEVARPEGFGHAWQEEHSGVYLHRPQRDCRNASVKTQSAARGSISRHAGRAREIAYHVDPLRLHLGVGAKHLICLWHQKHPRRHWIHRWRQTDCDGSNHTCRHAGDQRVQQASLTRSRHCRVQLGV